MRSDFFATGIVFPSRETIFLYGVDSNVSAFYDTVIDNSLTESAVTRKLDHIKRTTLAKNVELMTYAKTAMLLLLSEDEMRSNNFANLNEVIEAPSVYAPMTKIRTIKQELSNFRKVPYDDMCFDFMINVDGKHNVRMFTFVIYSPNDWGVKNPNISLDVARIAEQNAATEGMPKQADVGVKLSDVLISEVASRSIGATNAGSVSDVNSLSYLIHPFELQLVNMSRDALRKRTGNTISTNTQDVIRYMPISELNAAEVQKTKANNPEVYAVIDNVLNLYLAATPRIRDTEYLRNVKQEKTIQYEDEEFDVTNDDALLIYAPPGSGKTFFLQKNALSDVVLDTDYSKSQLNAGVMITNRHELIKKFKNSVAFVYDEKAWDDMVSQKITVQKGWYDSMMSSVRQASQRIQMGAGKRISDNIKVMLESTDVKYDVNVTKKAEKKKEDDLKDGNDTHTRKDDENALTTKEMSRLENLAGKSLSLDEAAKVDDLTSNMKNAKKSNATKVPKLRGAGKKRHGSDNFMK